MQVDSSVELGRDDPALEFPWRSEDGRIRYHDLKHNPGLIDDVPEAQQSNELRQFLLRINAPDCPLQTVKSDLWFSGEISPEEEIFAAHRKFVSYIDLVFAASRPRFSFQSHIQLVENLCSLLRRAPEMSASIEFVLRHCHYHSAENQNHSGVNQHHSVVNQDQFVESQKDSRSSQQHCVESSNPSQSIAGDAEKAIVHRTQHPETFSAISGEVKEPSSDLGTDSCTGFCITAYISGFGDHDFDARQQWEIALKLLQHAIVQGTRPETLP